MSNKTISRAVWLTVALALIVAVTWQFLPSVTAGGSVKTNISNAPTASAVSSASDDDSLILLNAGAINARSKEAQAERLAVGSFDGKRMHLVRFRGPIQPEWFKMLEESGAEIVDYIPNYTYLIYGDSNSIANIQMASLQAASPIEWEGAYLDQYRLSPTLYASKDKSSVQSLASGEFQIQLVKDDAANAATFDLINSIQTKAIKGQQEISHYVNFVVGLPEDGLSKLAAQPDVISIYPYFEPVKLDERQDIVLTGNWTGNAPTPGDYLAYLASKGFTQAQFNASGFLVDLTDSGVDTATPASPNQFALRAGGIFNGTSRFMYSRLEGTPHNPSTLQGCDGHGNLNASIIAGYVPSGGVFGAAPHADASGFRYGLGVAPFVKLGSSVIFDPASYTNPNLPNLQSKAYNDGARISSNSWGSSNNGYTSDSQAYDFLVRDAQPAGSTFPTAGNQEMVIVFAAGNTGSAANTVGSPGTGKNVITVGASEGVQAFGAADQCNVTDAQANSAMDIIPFSGRGPTADQRKKPDIMLPGTHISGTVAQNANVDPILGSTGAQLTCFDATGVCAGTGTNNFFPVGQQWYTASSGTSHSTPAISGVAALMRQDFINRGLTPPSPAMTKALLMNSAKYMTGAGANDTLPSNNQGMGLANLNNYFDIFAQNRIIRDQLNTDRFTASGQQRLFTGNIVDGSKPFRVTLAYTDKPGTTTGNAFVNNLDLEVTVGGNTYLGNVFIGANSSTGGSADIRNNVESVFIPAGVSGNFVVKVKATNIAGDGVPNNADALDQDFALIVSNASEAPLSVVGASAIEYVSENGTPANNVPDPGETIMVNLPLQEVGTANSASVTATLQNSGGITPVTTIQNYGVLTVGGPAVNRSFTFSVPGNAACGSSVTLTFTVQDGTTSFNVTRTYILGVLSLTTSENFDGVTIPALPASWTNTQTFGTAITWTTVNTGSNSAPNAAFANDPDTANASAMNSSSFAVSSPNAIVTFKNWFNTETGSSEGYDGMVLEIKIGAGAFQDILAAGGSFNTGGYNRTISTSFGSPISGRQAWSGNSGGYIDTSVNLPASANGQNVQLRWVMASDASVGVSNGGIRIDDFQVFGGYTCANVVAVNVRSRADFDGDGRTDPSVFRPSDGNWYIAASTAGISGINWGASTDIPVPGDYDNDNKTDEAVYRPSTGEWFIINSFDFSFTVATWGIAGDIPVAADYDGDGRADISVYRPSNGTWYIFRSNGTGWDIVQWGAVDDIPVPAKYDSDNKTDIAVYRPSTGQWFVLASAGGGGYAVNWGTSGDKPVAADYDGDGKDDLAVYRPSDGNWYFIMSSNNSGQVTNWGIATDIPVPGDYDGDGRDDVAQYRESTGDWFVLPSTSGFLVTNWGTTGDKPIPAAYIP